MKPNAPVLFTGFCLPGGNISGNFERNLCQSL